MAITNENMVQFFKGASANLPASRNANTLYFCTDTHQIYLGTDEYTKGTKVLNAEPTTSTIGDLGRLYAYNGNLYLCTSIDGGSYTYVRVANVNDFAGVTAVAAGEGLTTDTSGAISSTGTISHSVPSGATVVANQVAGAASLAFGGTFAVQGIATDKFGHVVGSTASTFTLPTETAVTVETAGTTTASVAHGGTFAAITDLEVGAADQSVKPTVTTFTLPADNDTTYTFATSTTTDGGVTVTPSTGSAYDVVPKGWSDLAKKSDITAVFKYKGTKASVADLPKTGASVGDVWQVGTSEYVCVAEATTDPAADAQWELLGPVIDLSAYALSDDVIQRVSPATAGNVPKLKADGTLEDTGFTLGCSVPSTAVFTDTTYAVATTAVDGLMSAADKEKLDGIEASADVNTIESITVAGTAITPDANKDVAIDLSSFGITKTAADINNVVEAHTWQSFPTT